MKTKKTGLQASDFVALHNHTHYSLLDGLQKVAPMVDRVKELGMEAVAMTDHGTLSGAIELYKEASARGVKPIIGIETYVAPRTHTDRDPSKDKANYHLILLAMNMTGYQNLMRLSTIANLEGFYYKPRIDHELLEKYNEGLIALSGCIGGEVGDAIRQGQYDQALEIATWYKGIFGDRYYIELQDHGHPDHPHGWVEQREVNKGLIKLAKELEIECVVTMDAHYLKHEDQEAHEILLCVQTGSFLDEESRMSLKDFELHIADPKDVISRWESFLPSAVRNTKVIADRCTIELELGKILIPKFPSLPKGLSEKQYLDELVYKGLAFRYGKKTEEEANKLSIEKAKKELPENVLERAEFELQIIDQMGFNGYFLIIWDFMKWGKDQGIVFGPGRGSAAGSIIAYSLNITELDPLEYDLLFERFLNPDRISMPDIDIDIQDTRRDEVIKYCVEKYGDDRVANIVTFGKMAARNAVRDVARVLRVPYVEADRLAKMIPPPVQGRHIPLEVSIKENTELKNEYKNNPIAKKVFDLAVRLEGTIRSHGVHAAGVVIAPDDIVKFVPLEKAQKGVIATQYSMGPVEELGLLKMDFLGLSNLTIIKNTLRIIKRVYGEDINIDRILMDDPKTFELLQRGDTTGVFQLESAGMKRYLKDLKPTEFNDIIAMCALYRPGPLTAGLTDSFVRRKNGDEEVRFDHPLTKNSLESTYGVIVYQEQVMQMSKEMCGFTGGEADTLRKAIGKKKRDVMDKMGKQFIEGAVENGVSHQVVEKIWKDILGFADYAFNKSHSACYALIAYQTAYLKAHYPAAFMAALMTSDYDDTDRLTIEMSECQNMGIEVLPPDVNESFVEFAVVPGKDQIRFGMSAIKNVGIGAVEEILRAREAGTFSSLEDFLGRVNSHTVNRKTIESLIKTGAFDRFESRSKLLNNIDSILAFSQKKQKEQDSGQTDLFGNELSDEAAAQIILGPEDTPYTTKDYLKWERELMGLYLSAHPLVEYKNILVEQAHPISDVTEKQEGKRATIGGIVTDARIIQTKNGQNMAFVRIADLKNDIELLVFPKVYEETSWLWVVDKVLIIEGDVNARDRDGNATDEVKVAVTSAREIPHEEAVNYKVGKKPIKALKDVKSKKSKIKNEKDTKQVDKKSLERVYIRMLDTDDVARLQALKDHLTANPGENEVVLVVGPADGKQAIRIPERLSTNDESLHGLAELFGQENVKVS
ncbi:DNA polymerase III subunit alpha [Candidatus Saccharibacteria bacterium]|nr:DNA polymerase III subunit alpha [Candidatus Saccharibacteria bacterium]MCA9328370.1 DNA polymerase III subunit alpha [Candidatus Saccharibacteria bacterium]